MGWLVKPHLGTFPTPHHWIMWSCEPVWFNMPYHQRQSTKNSIKLNSVWHIYSRKSLTDTRIDRVHRMSHYNHFNHDVYSWDCKNTRYTVGFLDHRYGKSNESFVDLTPQKNTILTLQTTQSQSHVTNTTSFPTKANVILTSCDLVKAWSPPLLWRVAIEGTHREQLFLRP